MPDDAMNDTPPASANLSIPPEAMAFMTEQARALHAMMDQIAVLHRRVEEILENRIAEGQGKVRRRRRKKAR
jgi:hypothetical protein